MTTVSTPEAAIPLSKRKLVLLLLGSIAFVAGNIWLWSIADTQPLYNPLYVRGVAIAGVSFFGLCAVYGCIKLLDGKPGLIIDDEGIVDNSSAISAGRILWTEITGLRVSEVAGQRLLTIDVIDPQEYIDRCGSFLRMLNAANTKIVGSPISISANSLKVSFDELVRIVTAALEKHRAAGRTHVRPEFGNR